MDGDKRQQELEKLKKKEEVLKDGCGKLDHEELRTITKLMDYHGSCIWNEEDKNNMRRIGPQTGSKKVKSPETSGINIL